VTGGAAPPTVAVPQREVPRPACSLLDRVGAGLSFLRIYRTGIPRDGDGMFLDASQSARHAV